MKRQVMKEIDIWNLFKPFSNEFVDDTRHWAFFRFFGVYLQPFQVNSL